jgi:hypothetical protein
MQSLLRVKTDSLVSSTFFVPFLLLNLRQILKQFDRAFLVLSSFDV